MKCHHCENTALPDTGLRQDGCVRVCADCKKKGLQHTFTRVLEGATGETQNLGVDW